jgi:DNA-binding IclR family transcriptional regulator
MSQTLDRALKILDFVGEKPRRIGEIATFLEVHHSTALRLLHTLRNHGFVHEMPDHRYRLGAATFRLGFQALDAIDIRSIARPFMEKLHEQTGETVHLGTLEDNEVVYVEKVEATRPLRLHSRIGAIATVHCTGVSKAILAFLPPTKRRNILDGRDLPRFTEYTHTTMESLEADLAASHERGFALDAEEHEPGIHCVGAPILSGAGEVAGAISVTAPLSRVDRDVLIGFVPALLAATQETSKQLGWRGP